jgi:aspartate/methionine/tyrosine aminotransferase
MPSETALATLPLCFGFRPPMIITSARRITQSLVIVFFMKLSSPKKVLWQNHGNALYKAFLYRPHLTSMRLCANALAQLVIPAAIADMQTPLSMVSPGGRIYEQRKATLDVLKDVEGLSFVKNSAAFYLFPKLDAKKFNITNDKFFARDLLQATNILVVPGSGFDWPEPDHFRIVMLPEAEELRSAMQRLGKFLETYQQQP